VNFATFDVTCDHVPATVFPSESFTRIVEEFIVSKFMSLVKEIVIGLVTGTSVALLDGSVDETVAYVTWASERGVPFAWVGSE
jgi:hypothetical protein